MPSSILNFEVSRAFAKRAWAICATDRAAKLQAIAATPAYQTTPASTEHNETIGAFQAFSHRGDG